MSSASPEGRKESPLLEIFFFKVAQFAWCPGSCVPLLRHQQKASDPARCSRLGHTISRIPRESANGLSQVESLLRRENEHSYFVSNYRDLTRAGRHRALVWSRAGPPGLLILLAPELPHPTSLPTSPPCLFPPGSVEGPQTCWGKTFWYTAIVQPFTNVLGKRWVAVLGGTQVI